MTKSTYGTGCFMLLNTGSDARASTHRLLTTPGYEIGDDRAYALEGSIFVAGAAIRWLRDKMCLADSAAETETLARAARDDHGVTVIPAFVGLGARHWRPHLRGIIDGLTLDTTAADLVRATLESIAFQTHDLTEAMKIGGLPPARRRPLHCELTAAWRKTGGSYNSWPMYSMRRLRSRRATRRLPFGAAALAGIGCGLFTDAADFGARWRSAQRRTPTMPVSRRTALLANWHGVIERALV